MRVFGSWLDWPAARGRLSGRLPSATMAALGEAFEFARVRHGGQVRPAGEPYVVHLLEVLEIAVEVGGCGDVDALRAALLHDVVEDTPATVEQVFEHVAHEQRRPSNRTSVRGLVCWG